MCESSRCHQAPHSGPNPMSPACPCLLSIPRASFSRGKNARSLQPGLALPCRGSPTPQASGPQVCGTGMLPRVATSRSAAAPVGCCTERAFRVRSPVPLPWHRNACFHTLPDISELPESLPEQCCLNPYLEGKRTKQTQHPFKANM